MQIRSGVVKEFFRTGAGLLGLCFTLSCSSGAPGEGDLGEETMRTWPLSCTSTRTTGCWENHNNAQSITGFSFMPSGLQVFADIKNRKLVTIDSPGTPPIGYKTSSQGMPSPTRWIAVQRTWPAYVAMLGDDSVVRYAGGDGYVTMPNDGNFDYTYIWAYPNASTGERLTLLQIEIVFLPNRYAASPELIGLASNGKVYQYSASAGWIVQSSAPALQMLPSRTYTAISAHWGSGGGATFLTNTGEVWRGMAGEMAQGGAVTYYPAVKANPITSGSDTFQPVALGGQYVLTSVGNTMCGIGGCGYDPYRIYKYDFGSGTWTRLGYGLPWYPQSISDLGQCSTSTTGGATACDPKGTLPSVCISSCTAFYPYYNTRIVDLGSTIAVRQSFSWIFKLRP